MIGARLDRDEVRRGWLKDDRGEKPKRETCVGWNKKAARVGGQMQ